MRSDHCTHCLGSHTGTRPCLASATEKARAWLLIEHPGPWADRLEETVLNWPGPSAAALATPVSRALARAREHSVRVQLIRRPGRRRTTPPIQVYAGWSGADAWLEGRELADPAELDALDLGAVGAGSRPGFGVSAGKLFLVCTNGKHNVCCARLGAPLARALRDGFGDAVWETTHVGGDRFSANMVCLPHGLYYGDLAVVDGLVAAARYLHDEVWLKHYRGRAGLPQAVQAAEHFLRVQSGIDSVAAVTIESVRSADSVRSAGVTDVVAGLGAERYQVSVERVPLEPCGPECTEAASTYVLRELTCLQPAPEAVYL
ncbi:MAG TPA: sucrase ferredoxin [Streptosporangiaceae bacterium]